MIFQPNETLLAEARTLLSRHERIFWVIGGSCSGKTTVCSSIAAQKDLVLYDMDEHIYGRYMGRYTWEHHPASKTWFSQEHPLEWVLSLSWEAFNSLNRVATAEYLSLYAEDMQSQATEEIFLVDGGITHPSILSQVIPAERIFCIDVESSVGARGWNDDPDRASMKEAVHNLPQPEASWHKFLMFDQLITKTIAGESDEAGIKIYRRYDPTGVSALADIILTHFGL